ncbi:hypothetical protein DKP76_01520 [Falsochrobactrum shanghaiense]|uniref:Uncharacterized protein n=2 Tax=Falsochrobactrum shanghaiense TaxID=2201899 RepID=A0A316JB96_9HYPH|nr:hypothetical protein DKP76_01520 [Falsochrobactrum shanghaiense]
MAREPSGDFAGAKTGGRVFLSGADLFFYSLIREFTAYGVAVRTAMGEAGKIANDSLYEMPAQKYVAIRRRVGFSEFELTDAPNLDDRPVAIIPIKQMMHMLIQRVEGAY